MPLKRISAICHMRSAPITFASCSSSVGLPKQAKPALRVEAPDGIIPLSNINIFNPGFLNFKSCAHQRPHKPAPTIMMSRSVKKLSCSQMEICMDERYNIREVHKKRVHIHIAVYPFNLL